MDHRRQLTTFVLMLGFFLLWVNVAPLLFPQFFQQPKPKPKPVAQQPDAPAPAMAAASTPAEPDQAAAATPADATSTAEQPTRPTLTRFPHREVILGDAAHGYLQRVQLTTTGAAIAWQELTQPEYRTLDRKAPLRLLSDANADTQLTLAVESPAFDIPLQEHHLTLATVDWQFVEEESKKIPDTDAYNHAVFRFPSPDGQWEAIRTYTLQPADATISDVDPTGYLLGTTLTFRRGAEGNTPLTYSMQGPVGLPLENRENTRIFRAVKAGSLQDSRDADRVTSLSLTASSVVSQIEDAEKKGNPGQRPVWRYPVKWVGTDVQYFAAFLIPQENQLENEQGQPASYFDEIVPFIVRQTDPAEQSDIGLVLKSRKLTVPPAVGSDVTHKFDLFLGPKRPQLLATFEAETAMDFGWFAPISKAMVALLNFFHHGLMVPYGLAIVLLTVIVRGCMFPLSKKQVANVQKMKEINPKLQELRQKHGNDKEAMTKAQLELMRKHGYNPLSGCLPIFLQLPIFVGLYNGLNTAIDLRLARFLWINNLAAPDAMFQLPFTVPFLGWTEFNLLPLLTIVLFIIQNKLFTPPPTSEEQALQFKMMNVMMAVIGVMFYRVPAGLCVYFIASSLWGIAERKLLDRHKRTLEESAAALAASGVPVPGPVKEAKADDEPPREPGFLAKLLAAADEAKHNTEGQSSRKKSARSKGPQSKR